MAEEAYAHHRKEEGIVAEKEEVKIFKEGGAESKEKEIQKKEEEKLEQAKEAKVVVRSRGFAGVPKYSEFHKDENTPSSGNPETQSGERNNRREEGGLGGSGNYGRQEERPGRADEPRP